MSEENIYHYCQELENAMCELCGKKSWNDSAGLFEQPNQVKKALRSALKRIRKRIAEIVTMDERLLLTSNSEVGALEREAGRLDGTGNNHLEIMAHLLSLVGYLLGYDWGLGKVNRHVIFFQTAEQLYFDDRRYSPQSHSRENQDREDSERESIVSDLFGKSFQVQQIARILNCPEKRVKDILVRTGQLPHRIDSKS